MSIPSSDRAAIRQTLRALKASGYTPSEVSDGEERVPVAHMGENGIIGILTSVDESWLYVTKDSQEHSTVFFVLGNDPDEVICDYSWDLDPVIGALFDRWID